MGGNRRVWRRGPRALRREDEGQGEREGTEGESGEKTSARGACW
jgi:hypothetical protein